MGTGGVTITWESLSGWTYYIKYKDDPSATWSTVSGGINGQTDTTSWTDNGTQITPRFDSLSLKQRFYRIYFEN